jgi:hypothetical protein
MVIHTYNPSYMGSIGRRITTRAKMPNPTEKITKAKKRTEAWLSGEGLPSNCIALSSNPSTTNKKERE